MAAHHVALAALSLVLHRDRDLTLHTLDAHKTSASTLDTFFDTQLFLPANYTAFRHLLIHGLQNGEKEGLHGIDGTRAYTRLVRSEGRDECSSVASSVVGVFLVLVGLAATVGVHPEYSFAIRKDISILRRQFFGLELLISKIFGSGCLGCMQCTSSRDIPS